MHNTSVGRVKSTYLNLGCVSSWQHTSIFMTRSGATPRPFNPLPPSPHASKLLVATELHHLVEAAFDGWLTTGHFGDAFVGCLSHFLGIFEMPSLEDLLGPKPRQKQTRILPC